MNVRTIVDWCRSRVTSRDVYWVLAMAAVAMSMTLVSRVTRSPDTMRNVRDAPAVVVVQRGGDAPVIVPDPVAPPSHVIHLACDHALRELEAAVDAAVNWSSDIDRLLHGAEGKPIAADPRLVAQFQLLRGRERVGVSEIRRKMTEVSAVRTDKSYVADDERARAVLANVLTIGGWAHAITDAYRTDERLLAGMNWTAHRLGVQVFADDPELADAARALWSDAEHSFVGALEGTEPDEERAIYGDPTIVEAADRPPSPRAREADEVSDAADTSTLADAPTLADATASAGSTDDEPRGRVAPSPTRTDVDEPRVLRKPRRLPDREDSPRFVLNPRSRVPDKTIEAPVRRDPSVVTRRGIPQPSTERGALNYVDLIRANLEWNGLTDVALRQRAGTIVARGSVQTEREMAELEAIVESVLHRSDMQFENRVRVDG